MSYSVKFKSQQGAAMLIFMLILISASSYALVNKLNSASKLYTRQQQSSDVLAEAKQALISYAVTYPDRVNADFGPGYLPCPDRNNDGSTDAGACASTSNTTIGRLPWVTLRLNDLRDSSGQRLWYVLSDNYRNNPKLEPLNSETAGQLDFDIDADGDIDNNDVDDIVAIIIAPGEPIVTGAGVDQNRDPSETNIVNEIGQYLEGDNADFDTGFVDSSANNVNDRLVYITRSELMQHVEKRVLGEVNDILSNYFSTHGAYPWLSPFADPKTTEKNLTGEHSGADDQANLTDSSINFNQWGVSVGDSVWNITDGSYGLVTAVAINTLTIGAGLSLGAENDFDTDDEYYVSTSTLPALFVGTSTATAGSSNLVLEDTSMDFNDLGVRVGDIVDNLTDVSSGVIESMTSTTLTVSSLTTGVFDSGDIYRIRTSMGRATADTDANSLTLEDTRVNFSVMGIVVGDLIRNITDGSYGRVSNVTANRLTVSELIFGTNNTFSENDYYSLPRLNSSPDTSAGLMSIHEVGESFKTDLDFQWVFTANAGDKTVSNSSILQTYIDNYAAAASESFDDSVGTCVWLKIDTIDCIAWYKDFVNISGNDTSSSNSDSIRDTAATFIADGLKRGDIAMNYDDETSVASGTVDAGNSGTATTDTDANGLTLEDTNNNFANIRMAVGDTIYNTTDGSSGTVTAFSTNQITVGNLTGGTNNVFASGDNYQVGDDPILYDASATFSSYERYSYLIQNNTLESDLGESKIQGVITDTFSDDTLEAEAYVGEGSEPIQFRPGDSYQIYQPRKFVIQTINSETRVTTDNYESGTNPDFDNGERYRIMPAANSQSANLNSAGTSGSYDYLIDWSADFVNDGVEVGDIVENHAGAFGEIVALNANIILAILYGGSSQDFSSGNSYTVYYDYVYSREHLLHARFSGNSNTSNINEERKRSVCLGYNSDCSATSATNFAGNGGVDLITINDFQEDETTNVGTATFRPSNLSSGSLLLSNINFYLNNMVGDFPVWFVNNNWHKLTYVAVSPGDEPGSAVACSSGANCLTANIVKSGTATVNDDVNALVIAAGAETNKVLNSACSTLASTPQNRTNGTINEYFESENCDQSDDTFQKQIKAASYNDQVFILATTP